MAIDFNGVNSNAANPQQRDGVRQRSDSGERTANPQQPDGGADQTSARSTRVELSPDARNIEAAEKALQEQPEIDDQKVAEIRQALEDGSFTTDAEQLAQKMLDIDQSIFG